MKAYRIISGSFQKQDKWLVNSALGCFDGNRGSTIRERNSSEVKAGALGSFVKNSDNFQVNWLVSSAFILINFAELLKNKQT